MSAAPAAPRPRPRPRPPPDRPAPLAVPRPITQLNATDIGAREITLAWDRPAGVFTDFEVQYLTDADTLANRTTADTGLTIAGLRPYTLYTFTVEVRAGTPASILTRSPAHSAAFETREAPPAAPSAFQPADAKPNELTFVWELPPRDRHGVLRRFLVEYAPQHEPRDVRTLEFPPDGQWPRARRPLSPIAPRLTAPSRSALGHGGGAGAGRHVRVPAARRDGRGRGRGGALDAAHGHRRAATAAAVRAAAARAPLAHHHRRALPRGLLLLRQRQRDGVHARAGRGAAQRHAREAARLARRAPPARLAALPGAPNQ